MTQEEILSKLTEIFRDVFDDRRLVITRDTTAEDIFDWDSLNHMTLISEAERVRCKIQSKRCDWNAECRRNDRSNFRNAAIVLCEREDI